LALAMIDIGQTLRDARIREHVDIAEIEFRTKIRAKYLRALENEEWGLLPGPTFVRTFLRTYAEALGLDGRALVDEYKRREVSPSELEALPPVRSGSGRERRSAPRPAIPRWLVAVILGVALIVALAVIGVASSSDNNPPHTTTAAKHTKTGASHRHTTTPLAHHTTTVAPTHVSLKLIPSGSVYVCLVGDGRIRRRETMTPATPQPTFHARRFVLTVGDNALAMVIGGRAYSVPASSSPLTYSITLAGRALLHSGTPAICG
jgi:cytoskeleton protein RodZ